VVGAARDNVRHGHRVADVLAIKHALRPDRGDRLYRLGAPAKTEMGVMPLLCELVAKKPTRQPCN
jgi:hypothetical protein